MSQFAIETSLLSAFNSFFFLILPLIKVSFHYSLGFPKSALYKIWMRFSRHTSPLKMQRARYPCRQLDSKTIRSAALCYLSLVFLGKCSVISAKCVCDVQEGFENAWNNVCRNRDACDRALHGLFVNILPFETCFLSCLVFFLLQNKLMWMH